MPPKDAVKRAPAVLERMGREYGEPYCFLDGKEEPFHLLIAIVLSAQCTDAQVNRVTPNLFARYPTPEALAKAPIRDVEHLIYSTGFYKNKAKNIRECARQIVERFNGEVPRAMADLVTLPGVGRKTANVLQSYCWGQPEGVCVDTHVGRVAYRLGLTRADPKDAIKVEQDLMRLYPPEDWERVPFYFISHGRAVCDAKKPRCGECFVADLCPKKGVRAVASRATASPATASVPARRAKKGL